MEDVLVLQDCVLVATNFKTGQDGFESRHIEERSFPYLLTMTKHLYVQIRVYNRISLLFNDACIDVVYLCN